MCVARGRGGDDDDDGGETSISFSFCFACPMTTTTRLSVRSRSHYSISSSCPLPQRTGLVITRPPQGQADLPTPPPSPHHGREQTAPPYEGRDGVPAHCLRLYRLASDQEGRLAGPVHASMDMYVGGPSWEGVLRPPWFVPHPLSLPSLPKSPFLRTQCTSAARMAMTWVPF